MYDNFIYGSQTNLRDLGSRIQIEMGDILGWRLVDTLKRFQPDYVFHLAAEPYIPKCYENPEKFLDVNIKGTLNVLMTCKLLNVQRMVHFSTSEVYGTAKSIPMDESHPTLPLSTYAVSKLASDRLCYVFSREHNIPVTIVRPFNSYGPRETQPYVIPEIITQLAKGNKLSLGNVRARRDFTYVQDLAQGAIAVMESDIPSGEVINIGSNKTYSVEEIAHTIGRVLGRQSIEIEIDKAKLRPMDVDTLQCDYSKIQKYTGWRPRIDLEDGLKRTVRWFLDNGKQWSWEAIPSLANNNVPSIHI